ncbi:MAG: cytochrome c oxidase subunit II [Planctomycetaceae bacterium]|nr:cytochrome c oxidase subunit II [Planctomycetaceae bacterium]
MDSTQTFTPPSSPPGSFWFPSTSSTVAHNVDDLFYLILWISVVFFVLIVGVMTWFVWQYRRRAGVVAEHTAHHNTTLEVTWSVIPGLILVVIFYEGFTGYLDLRTPPPETYEIQVIAKKWAWAFRYPNGHISDELHLPVDTPVKFRLQSDDVIHSFFVPAFRVKMDCVPGRYTTTWAQATQTGEFVLYCAEYCGTRHSDMLARVVVHESGEFDTWLAKESDFLNTMTPEAAGKLLYQRRGCIQCHSVDGSAKQGPTFQGTYGTQQALADGTTITVDDNYIRESILNPMAKVRGGYRPVMPTFQGQLKDAEIDALIAFMKSLK